MAGLKKNVLRSDTTRKAVKATEAGAGSLMKVLTKSSSVTKNKK